MSDKPFVWFDHKATAKLLDGLIRAGEGARLEVHPIGDSVVEGSFHLVVVPEGHGGHDPINDSHLCPPSCP